MKKIIGNLKINATPDEIKKYMIDLLARVDFSKADLTLCLSYTSFATAKYFIENTPIKLGAQNIADDEDAKCVGEISGKMLVGCGVETVLVGHSDRRAKFKENNKTINKKIKIALKNRLNVVLCVGETLAEKNTLKTLESLKTQLDEGLKGLYENELENVIISYEPVWAVGNDKNATIKEIEYAVKAIRKILSDDFSSKAAKNMQIIYGGGVNNKNIQSFMKMGCLDGVMIGTACSDPANFVSLIGLC